MAAKLQISYFYFFLGFWAILMIFILGSQRPGAATKVYREGSIAQADANCNRSLSFRDILSCSDKVLEKNVFQMGNFVVFQNFIVADRQFGCDESITLTSPGDYRFLDNVVPLVDRWRGPVSVALYAPGFDFFTTLQCISYLRTCKTTLIREYVTFHLYLENVHLLNKSAASLTGIYKDTYDCGLKPPYETMKGEDMYKEKHGLMYPVNVARNVAKISAQTYFVFPSDIELYPTRNFIEKFFDMIAQNPCLVQKDINRVFVLPIFEVRADQQVPDNKTQLQTMFKEKKAILFHETFCAPCHKVPDGDKWMKADETEGLKVFSEGKREGIYSIWEPIFVCTQKEPLWDERLNLEGDSDKMSQVYAMCLLQYKFLVLDNAFLIHKPGVKMKKVKVLGEIRKNNKILFMIEKELQQVYGENKKCTTNNLY